MKKDKPTKEEALAVVNEHAAGIDVGSTSFYVAIGQQRDQVREFGCYTSQIHQLCQWLKQNQITTVALESTGSYWKALFILLQDYELNPILVNGKYTKNVKGKKTDVLDCQWIQRLHTLGLLEGSFLPDVATEKLRTYLRHRQALIQNAGDYINKMQKALRLTNIRLDAVITDVTGKSGTLIIEAIIRGERDPHVLASLADARVKKSKQELIEALTGDWRDEYLFELRHSYELYCYLHGKVQECDQQMKRLLEEWVTEKEKQEGEQRPSYPGGKKKAYKNEPRLDVQTLFYQLSGGIDLAAIEGIGPNALLTLLAETGLDLKAFPSAKHFCSWLRLAPNNKITGKKVLSSKTVAGRNRLAEALRHAANAIGRMKEGTLHHFFQRIAYRKSRLAAITATARKLAVIIWNMLTHKQNYMPADQSLYLNKIRVTQLKNLQRKIRQLNIKAEELHFVST
jgi:transposase